MCYCYAVAAGQNFFSKGIRKWSKHLTDFQTPKFKTIDWEQQWRAVMMDIYYHLCLTDVSVKTALINTGPRPFTLHCLKPWGYAPNDPDTCSRTNIVSDILIDTRVLATTDKLTSCRWLEPRYSRPGMRNVARSLVPALLAQA